MARYDMFGHDQRDKEERDAEIKAKNEAYFNRKKKKPSLVSNNPEAPKKRGGFHGLTPKEKAAVKKGVSTVKKGVVKAGKATVSGAKKVAKVTSNVAKKGYSATKKAVGKGARAAKSTAKYTAYAGATAVGKAERSKTGKKIKESLSSLKQSVSDYGKKHGKKKKAKFNMDTKKWE
tara:strand:- start:248 stop:775 length:528 start_codon:yes stop_codon:yes gene_type:complete